MEERWRRLQSGEQRQCRCAIARDLGQIQPDPHGPELAPPTKQEQARRSRAHVVHASSTLPKPATTRRTFASSASSSSSRDGCTAVHSCLDEQVTATMATLSPSSKENVPIHGGSAPLFARRVLPRSLSSLVAF